MFLAKACLHLHIKGDPIDNITYDFSELIKTAKNKNFKIIAVTAHDKFIFTAKMQQTAKDNGILLIPGIEKTIENKHVVILNATKQTENIETFRQLKSYKIKNPNCFILAVHPYFYLSNCLKNKLEEHINLFDGIEFNYFYHKFINPNKKAIKIAKQYNLPLIGTSDVHLLEYLDPTYSQIKIEKLDTLQVISALKKNQLDIITKSFSILELFKILSKLVIAQLTKK